MRSTSIGDNGKAIIAYILVCFFWGSTYLAIKIGVQDMPPMFFAGIRFVIAGSLMILYQKCRKAPSLSYGDIRHIYRIL